MRDLGKLKGYVEERDKAITESIKADSVEPFKEFIRKNALMENIPDCYKLPPDEVLAISIRKAALHSNGVEPLYKGLAVNWLLERGYDLDLN